MGEFQIVSSVFLQKLVFITIGILFMLFCLVNIHACWMFIFISISLKMPNILENKSQVFERRDCTIT